MDRLHDNEEDEATAEVSSVDTPTRGINGGELDAAAWLAAWLEGTGWAEGGDGFVVLIETEW